MTNSIPTNLTNLLLEDIQPRQKDKKHEMGDIEDKVNSDGLIIE